MVRPRVAEDDHADMNCLNSGAPRIFDVATWPGAKTEYWPRRWPIVRSRDRHEVENPAPVPKTLDCVHWSVTHCECEVFLYAINIESRSVRPFNTPIYARHRSPSSVRRFNTPARQFLATRRRRFRRIHRGAGDRNHGPPTRWQGKCKQCNAPICGDQCNSMCHSRR